MDTSRLLDAVSVATVAGSIVLAGAWLAAGALPRLSCHIRHQLLGHALLTCLGLLAATVALNPIPAGWLTRAHESRPNAERSGEAQAFFTMSGAGKVRDGADAPVPPRATSPEPTLRDVVLESWIVGASIFFFRAAHRRWAAYRLVRSACRITDAAVIESVEATGRRLGLRHGVRVLRHRNVTAPAVGGTFRPTLFLPAGLEREGTSVLSMILLHELAHVRRRDGLVTLMGEVATAAFWFNPLVWLAARRMRALQEVAADSYVVSGGVRPSRYAKYLLEAFRSLRGSPAASLASTHSILGESLMESRLHSILDPTTIHHAPARALSIAIAASFGLVLGGLLLAPASLHAMGVLKKDRPPRGRTLNRALLNPASIDGIVRPVVIDKLADSHVAGAVVAVVHEGNVVYQGGFGRREVYFERPVDPERTIFRIGSITKVLTAVAVMQLVDRNHLRLDADVNEYLTAVKVPPTFADPVRVRHLLTHTAGFDQVGLGRHAANRESVRSLSAFLGENLVRIHPPGEVSTYDTYAITLAGHLVEQLSGLSYEEYLIRNIFDPLEMRRSGIVVPPALAGDVAVGYEFRGQWYPQEWEHMNTVPASSANSTASDMAHFAIMMLQGGKFHGRQVLSEDSVRAMLSRQYGNHPDQPGYGYAFWEDRSQGVPAFSHGGSMTGFGALLYLVPEADLGVFIACNQESDSLPGALLTRLISELMPGEGATPALRRKSTEKVDLSRFTGNYSNSIYNHGDPTQGWRRRPFPIEANADGALVFQGANAYPVGPLTFQRDDGLLLTFRENARGEITYLFVNQAVFERLR